MVLQRPGVTPVIWTGVELKKGRNRKTENAAARLTRKPAERQGKWCRATLSVGVVAYSHAQKGSACGISILLDIRMAHHNEQETIYCRQVQECQGRSPLGSQVAVRGLATDAYWPDVCCIHLRAWK
jgi:hypothetical protein